MFDLNDTESLIEAIRPVIISMHDHIRDLVVAACEHPVSLRLSDAVAHEGGDTIYAIDRIGESHLVESLNGFARSVAPLVLVAEGLASGQIVLPKGASESEAPLRVIVDPIDGTRGLMYQKRSAWILTGVAPNRGEDTSLHDICLSVMTEIPLVKQHLSDQVWGRRGHGIGSLRFNRFKRTVEALQLSPSRAGGIEHGFATLARLVPGERDVLAAMEEELVRRLTGPRPEGVAICFEDQYISTGGQMYELFAGHDRLVADLRSLTKAVSIRHGRNPGLCCHPYDLAGLVIPQELGVVITDADGGPLRAPLDTRTDVSWIGYANKAIRDKVEPHLLRLIEENGLAEAGGGD